MKIELLSATDADSSDVSRLLDLLRATKAEAASNGDAERANNCWREIEGLEINCRFIRAFEHIKNKSYRDAWCLLEECEIRCKSLERNSSNDFMEKSRANFIKNIVAEWQSLYPYCVFISPSIVVGYYTCSVCDHKIRPRSRCEHRKGLVYSGELCVHVAHEIDFKDFSIVANPVQKYSVMHDDDTLDFSLIEHLAELLDNAFEGWHANWTTIKFAIGRFSSVGPEDKCPCKSGAAFEACCGGKTEVEIPHVDFVVHKQLPEKDQGIRFPYDG